MMRRLILGAAAAAAIAFAAPAQASMANPQLGAAASGNVEQAQFYFGGGPYYGHRRGYYDRGYGYGPRRHWNRGYAYAPRCWTQRVVRYDGRVRFVRRCR
jgi:hypothetical protein